MATKRRTPGIRSRRRGNADDCGPDLFSRTASEPRKGAGDIPPGRGTSQPADDPVARTIDAAVEQGFATAGLAPAHAKAEFEKLPGSSEPLAARMLNEFVYCQRLFYYEYVEGVFVKNADTLRGEAIHARVDRGTGALAKPEAKTSKPPGDRAKRDAEPAAEASEIDTIHSRSVMLSSERLGVIAKMDLIEAEVTESREAVAVCPVDYKAGTPREEADGNGLWDTDKMQLGLQCLILRDNGYRCDEGVIYYRGTKQRVRLAITPDLIEWIVAQIAAARVIAAGPIPPPLVDSPKCTRCSLAPVCLPDETRMLASERAPTAPIRTTHAARDDRKPLYLNTQGARVGCSDEVLKVKERDKLLQEVRVSDVSHVALFGNVQISSQAIRLLCDKEVPITYFSMGGWYNGTLRGHSLKNVFLRIEQFRHAADPQSCLQLARQFVCGKITNHRVLFMRNHVEPPEPVKLRLGRAREDALAARSIQSLLGIEGAAAALYFEHFNGMLRSRDDLEDATGAGESAADETAPEAGAAREKLLRTFNFTTRNRRPPTDPVNALLSLAYSCLVKECTLAAHSVGFDPYIGFYHQPRYGRAALALDLMEEFRPLIAESAVTTAINNRFITLDDFVSAGNAVNLGEAGRKRFFICFEQRMNHQINHPVFDYRVTYRRAIELQFRILARALTGEIPEYIPFTTR